MAKASEKNIIVVDDEPDVREFLSAIIKDAGFNVRTAVDGVDGFEKIMKYKPDLVTVDMVMPRKGGFRLVRKLRKDRQLQNIPVIIITAHAQDEFGKEDIEKFYGFAIHVRPRYIMDKPIVPETLINNICTILEVEPEEKKIMEPERSAVLDVLKGADLETIKKVSQMLNA